MDWMQFARNDWDVYHNPARIHKYVEFGKITPTQYEQITGEAYV